MQMKTDDASMPLSVIVPILNETDHLPALFSTLRSQAGIDFELILVDGGSTDSSQELAGKLADQAGFPCRFANSGSGRGRQMNQGVQLSSGETLLFLHADSRFVEPHALAKALDCLDKRISASGHDRFAGHFAMRFQKSTGCFAPGFYYLESKARLERAGCIHGDQGFLLRRSFFDRVGPFDESLAFLEDNRLAQQVRGQGDWLLLPAELLTSSRRFHEEGFRQRQMLNALIMNLEAVGQGDLLAILPDIYRQQDRTRKLQLRPFFRKLACCLSQKPLAERLRFWYGSGRYLVANAWQLAFYLDVRRAYRAGLDPGEGRRQYLRFFDCFLFRLIDHPPGYCCAALLTWVGFRILRVFG